MNCYKIKLAPLAFILDKAGGLASNGSVPIMDLKPTSHDTTAQVFMGSILEVKKVE
jgi:fructose-1,6-bisphosphatase I